MRSMSMYSKSVSLCVQQLRTALEEIRNAIDHYRGMADRGKFPAPVGSHNYPLDLETLVKGVVDVHGKTIKSGRRFHSIR